MRDYYSWTGQDWTKMYQGVWNNPNHKRMSKKQTFEKHCIFFGIGACFKEGLKVKACYGPKTASRCKHYKSSRRRAKEYVRKNKGAKP